MQDQKISANASSNDLLVLREQREVFSVLKVEKISEQSLFCTTSNDIGMVHAAARCGVVLDDATGFAMYLVLSRPVGPVGVDWGS